MRIHALVPAFAAACGFTTVTALSSAARADCPVDKSVRAWVSCDAELIGLADSKLSLSEHSEPGAFEMTGPSKRVKLAWGDFALTGGLVCSGKSSASMGWSLEVELDKKGSAAPVAYMRVDASDAAARKGKAPLAVTSYGYFDPAIPHPTRPAAKLTRIDYTCALHVD